MTPVATPSWPSPWPAMRIATTTWPSCTARPSRLRPAAVTGRSPTATSQAAEQAARTFGGFAAILAASARGILGLARDDPDEALRGAALALAVPEIDCYDDPAAFWWRPAQVWALIRTGHLGQAEEILAAIRVPGGRPRRSASALTQAAWLRGSLAMARGDLDRADQVLLERPPRRGWPALAVLPRAAGSSARPVPVPAAAAQGRDRRGAGGT